MRSFFDDTKFIFETDIPEVNKLLKSCVAGMEQNVPILTHDAALKLEAHKNIPQVAAVLLLAKDYLEKADIAFTQEVARLSSKLEEGNSGYISYGFSDLIKKYSYISSLEETITPFIDKMKDNPLYQAELASKLFLQATNPSLSLADRARRLCFDYIASQKTTNPVWVLHAISSFYSRPSTEAQKEFCTSLLQQERDIYVAILKGEIAIDDNPEKVLEFWAKYACLSHRYEEYGITEEVATSAWAKTIDQIAKTDLLKAKQLSERYINHMEVGSGFETSFELDILNATAKERTTFLKSEFEKTQRSAPSTTNTQIPRSVPQPSLVSKIKGFFTSGPS